MVSKILWYTHTDIVLLCIKDYLFLLGPSCQLFQRHPPKNNYKFYVASASGGTQRMDGTQFDCREALLQFPITQRFYIQVYLSLIKSRMMSACPPV